MILYFWEAEAADPFARRDWPALPRVGDVVRLLSEDGRSRFVGVVGGVLFADHVDGQGKPLVDSGSIAVVVRGKEESAL